MCQATSVSQQHKIKHLQISENVKSSAQIDKYLNFLWNYV